MSNKTFRDLFAAHEGKVSDKWDHYLSVYEEIFAPLRNQQIDLLEVGVQNGGSLEIWAAYFSRASTILGVDIDPSCGSLQFDDSRISVLVGDAKTAEMRDEIRARAASFNIIIDDGSHISSDIIATFLRLVPLLADNGVYVVEDMHASYWKELGGELFAPYSAASFFKTLTDVLNYEHWSLNKAPAELLQPFADHVQIALPMEHLERIESITFLNSVCIIRKTAGAPTRLGERRLSGHDSDVTKVERFPVEAFARKSRLAEAGDYFFAWQKQPPMETLAAQARLVADLEQQVSDYGRQVADLEDEGRLLREQLADLTIERERELQELRERSAALELELEKGERQAVDLLKAQQEMRATQEKLEVSIREADSLRRELLATQGEMDQLNTRLVGVYQSSSWRITAPLRSLKRLAQFVWHFERTFVSHGSFFMGAASRLTVRMLAEPNHAEAMLRRIEADPGMKSTVLQFSGMTPGQYAALSVMARWLGRGYRHLRGVRRRLSRSGTFSGVKRGHHQIRRRGFYFHLDRPLGVLVSARGVTVFSGWAVDTNAKEAAELRVVVNGHPMRTDRFKRGDVTAAFLGKISPDATPAFETQIPLLRRFTQVSIEVATEPGEWTLVHRAIAFRVGPVEQVRLSRTYTPAEWINVLKDCLEAQSDEVKGHMEAMTLRPRFVVVVDARRSTRDFDATRASLHGQGYPASQLVVLGGVGRVGVNARTPLDITGDNERWIERFDIHDPMFAEADYVVFVETGDLLAPSALYELASAINGRPTSALIYGDELFRTSSDQPLPFRKPDWSADYLESFDYVGRGAAFSIERVRKLSLGLSSLYDFTLRFTEGLEDDRVLHIESVLLDRGQAFTSSGAAADDIVAIQGRLERTGRLGSIVQAPSGTDCYHVHVSWARAPLVSIVIPTAGYTKTVDGRELDLIVNITGQIVQRSTYPAVEIVVVDNGDLSADQRDHLAGLGCRSITYREPTFNVAKKLNLGASIARGEFLLLMNDDMEIIQDDWIERLCDHLAKPEVGVVGCKLLYPDRTTQHVGVIHYHGNPDHVRRGYPMDDAGYFNSTCGVRNYLAVTGACMLTRKSLYDQVGGYTEQLAISYNDADFCLKVRDAGYRVVYTGDVALVHMESLSRVPSANPEEVRYYRERWTPGLPEDPFYNERFLTLAPPSFEPRTNDRLL